MLLNKGDSPITEGTWRALLTALATLASVTLLAYQANLNALTDPERLKEALIAGAIAALAPFVAQTAMALSDQRRAENDDIKAADVPVAAEGIAVRKV